MDDTAIAQSHGASYGNPLHTAPPPSEEVVRAGSSHTCLSSCHLIRIRKTMRCFVPQYYYYLHFLEQLWFTDWTDDGQSWNVGTVQLK